MDPRAQQAREHHRKSQDAAQGAGQHRAQRDSLVQELWATQRDKWTYAKLAKAVKCSPELIATIIKGKKS